MTTPARIAALQQKLREADEACAEAEQIEKHQIYAVNVAREELEKAHWNCVQALSARERARRLLDAAMAEFDNSTERQVQ